MKARAVWMIPVAVVLLGGPAQVQTPSPSAATTFVGTTPCDEAIRAFIGGMAAGECRYIKWQLNLGVTERNALGWDLDAIYGVPEGGSIPGRSLDGPHASIRGRLEKTATTYRLISDAGRSISFRQISSGLIHPLDDKNTLMLGTSAGSYTLARADMTDDPGQPEQMHGPDYALSPRETGNTVFGIFGGRTPCMGLARAMRIALTDGCQRVKWRITLLQKAGTSEPTTYKIEGSLHHSARVGAWHIVRGTTSDPDAVVYQLDGTAGQGPMLLWRADDVVFLLDERKQPLVGTIAFSYTLSREK